VQNTEFLSSDEIRLLTEIGMLGTAARLHEPALTLFQALAELRPGRDFPWVGQAVVWLNRSQPEEAVRVLKKACECVQDVPAALRSAHPADLTLLTAFLGFAQHLARHTADSHQTLSQVFNMPHHPHAYAIAQDMLGMRTGKPGTDPQLNPQMETPP